MSTMMVSAGEVWRWGEAKKCSKVIFEGSSSGSLFSFRVYLSFVTAKPGADFRSSTIRK